MWDTQAAIGMIKMIIWTYHLAAPYKNKKNTRSLSDPHQVILYLAPFLAFYLTYILAPISGILSDINCYSI